MEEWPIPANTKAEQGVLACIMYQPRYLVRVVDTLHPEHFCDESNRTVYEVLCSLRAENKTITPFTVAAELERRQVRTVTQFDLEQLKYSHFVSEPVEHYADEVRATSTHRRLYELAGYMAGEALHQQKGAVERVMARLESIALDMDIRQPASLHAALERYMTIIDQRRENFARGIDNGLRTGIAQLDRLLIFKKSKLYILAAQTSVGKSAIAQSIAFNAISHARGHVLFFSLEMDEDELIQRLIAMDAPIDQTLLDSGNVSDEEYAQVKAVRDRLQNLDLEIEDQVYLLPAILAEARQAHARKKLDLIVIDYLQIMDMEPSARNKNEARYQEVGTITKALKRLARDLKVPVLLLSQLSRKSEEHIIPKLSDLYESSKIAQDADLVMLAYVEESEEKKRQDCEPYVITVQVGKQRNGRIGSAKIRFRPRITKAESLVEDERYVPPR